MEIIFVDINSLSFVIKLYWSYFCVYVHTLFSEVVFIISLKLIFPFIMVTYIRSLYLFTFDACLKKIKPILDEKSHLINVNSTIVIDL